jgi:hypothetical protein
LPACVSARARSSIAEDTCAADPCPLFPTLPPGFDIQNIDVFHGASVITFPFGKLAMLGYLETKDYLNESRAQEREEEIRLRGK